jgi:hypothetical protein
MPEEDNKSPFVTMRIGIDVHSLAPEHHRHHPDIAEYTRRLVETLLEQDQENTYVLFVDSRMPQEDLERFNRPNAEIKHFPFAQYRSYLPFVYAHMLVSSYLTAARLDLFHSPEGLIPYLYPGKIIATFHWVPTGYRDANVFVKTWMLGARTGFKAFSRKADRIILLRSRDHDILCEIHGYPEKHAVVLTCQDLKTLDWPAHARDVRAVYEELAAPKKKQPPTQRSKARFRRLIPRPRLPRLRKAAPPPTK